MNKNKTTRFLIKQLVIRDFKIKYKRSFLGVIWSLLNPLLLSLIQYIVFSNFFRYNISNYGAYLLIGVVVFNYFSDSMGQSIQAILSNSTLLTKVKLPKEVFPLAKVLSCGINFLLSLVPVFLICFFSGCKPTIALLMLPLDFLFLFLFLLGGSFILSALMVYFRDIMFIWNVISMLWMYATPIFYPVSILPEWLACFERYNPLYLFISYFRTVVIEGLVPELDCIVSVVMCGSLGFLFGYCIFIKLKRNLVLYL